MSGPVSVVLCEGYHDRAFWCGWLKHLGCIDPGAPDVQGKRKDVIDGWGKVLGGGKYGFKTPTDRDIRVIPCGSDSRVLPDARLFLQGRATKPLPRLVVCLDLDLEAGAVGGKSITDLLNELKPVAPDAALDGAGDIAIDGGSTVVSLVHWSAPDPPADLLPAKQTLERLVCAALAEAYPDRAAKVRDWLKSRPSPPPASPKEFAWSHMAGWYAERGCEAFHELLWQDAAVVGRLERRLEEIEASRVAGFLVG